MLLASGLAACGGIGVDLAAAVASIQCRLQAAAAAADRAKSFRDAGDEGQAQAALAAGVAQLLATRSRPSASVEKRSFEQGVARLQAQDETLNLDLAAARDSAEIDKLALIDSAAQLAGEAEVRQDLETALQGAQADLAAALSRERALVAKTAALQAQLDDLVGLSILPSRPSASATAVGAGLRPQSPTRPPRLAPAAPCAGDVNDSVAYEDIQGRRDVKEECEEEEDRGIEAEGWSDADGVDRKRRRGVGKRAIGGSGASSRHGDPSGGGGRGCGPPGSGAQGSGGKGRGSGGKGRGSSRGSRGPGIFGRGGRRTTGADMPPDCPEDEPKHWPATKRGSKWHAAGFKVLVQDVPSEITRAQIEQWLADQCCPVPKDINDQVGLSPMGRGQLCLTFDRRRDAIIAKSVLNDNDLESGFHPTQTRWWKSSNF